MLDVNLRYIITMIADFDHISYYVYDKSNYILYINNVQDYCEFKSGWDEAAIFSTDSLSALIDYFVLEEYCPIQMGIYLVY